VLDKLWKSVGKEGAVCAVCATLPPNKRVSYSQLHSHHIIKRGHKATRWDIRNRIWLCPTHHTLGKETAEYNEFGWFFSEGNCWLKTYRGKDHKYLLSKKHEVKNWKFDELLIIYEGLKENDKTNK